MVSRSCRSPKLHKLAQTHRSRSFSARSSPIPSRVSRMENSEAFARNLCSFSIQRSVAELLVASHVLDTELGKTFLVTLSV